METYPGIPRLLDWKGFTDHLIFLRKLSLQAIKSTPMITQLVNVICLQDWKSGLLTLDFGQFLLCNLGFGFEMQLYYAAVLIVAINLLKNCTNGYFFSF